MSELRLEPLPRTGRQRGNEPTALVINRFPCLLGRSESCDQRLDDLMISRRHCVFTTHDGHVWIEDLGSRNGTRLNGERLTDARPIEEGDALQVGRLAFRAHLSDADQSGVAAGAAGERADSRGPD
jgi:pSer/pThr/pTyr-binding forkhead associated (FHA) protein